MRTLPKPKASSQDITKATEESLKLASSMTTRSHGDRLSPPRATYTSLYPPESDAEFVRSVATSMAGHGNRRQRQQHIKVADTAYSCRQMYLKSYTFTKKGSAHEKAKKYVAKIRKKVVWKVAKWSQEKQISDIKEDAKKQLHTLLSKLTSFKCYLSQKKEETCGCLDDPGTMMKWLMSSFTFFRGMSFPNPRRDVG